ncbi:nucleotidyltransferase [Candidatus Sumerlaeota bacterium]
MEAQPDFKELLELLNAHAVEFVIVGAQALAFHGAPRYTGDLDVYVRPSAQNAERIMAALERFGFGDVGLSASDFAAPDKVVQLGHPPVRIDLMTSLSGVTWDEVAGGAAQTSYGGVPVRHIGRQQFITNKKACGRQKDLADIEALGAD